MSAVCTRNGWSPNPADLSCVGTYVVTELCVFLTTLRTRVKLYGICLDV